MMQATFSECPECNKTFQSNGNRNHKIASHCSKECYQAEYRRAHRKEIVLIKEPCIECGNSFSVNKNSIIFRKFCSRACSNKFYVKKRESRSSRTDEEKLITKENGLKYRYGLTLFQLESLLIFQKYNCLVCNLPLTEPYVVDHDHTCCPSSRKTCGKCVRGILHSTCNAALGFLKDDPAILRKAATYLEVSKQMQPFKITVEESIKFSKVWTYNGISIPISSESCQFAADFANIVLRDFVSMVQERSRQKIAQTSPPAQPKLIVEGV